MSSKNNYINEYNELKNNIRELHDYFKNFKEHFQSKMRNAKNEQEKNLIKSQMHSKMDKVNSLQSKYKIWKKRMSEIEESIRSSETVLENNFTTNTPNNVYSTSTINTTHAHNTTSTAYTDNTPVTYTQMDNTTNNYTYTTNTSNNTLKEILLSLSSDDKKGIIKYYNNLLELRYEIIKQLHNTK